MVSNTAEAKAKKNSGKVEKPAEELSAEEVLKQADPLEDLLSQAQNAYASYVSAQRKVASAYKQREAEEINAFKTVEQEAPTAIKQIRVYRADGCRI